VCSGVVEGEACLDNIALVVLHCSTAKYTVLFLTYNLEEFMNASISVRISKDMAKRLDNIAKETERPRSFIIQKALESYIDEIADLQIALDRLHDTSDTVISSKEMRKSLEI